jgi:predicted branched-subunit amino acid permease
MAAVGEAARRAVLRQAMGVGVATGAYGVSFGALATAGGLSTLQACALSVLAFTGGSQFALVGVVASGGSPWAGAGAAVLLGVRNAFYGLRLARLLGRRGPSRAVAAHLVIDESTAVAIGQVTEPAGRLGFWATGSAVFAFWNLATLAGAVAGNALGDPATWGLDAAAPAAFLALLSPRLRARTDWLVALAAACVALALVAVTPPGIPVMAAALVAVIAGLRSREPSRGTHGQPGGQTRG